jgi:hypothetical protein
MCFRIAATFRVRRLRFARSGHGSASGPGVLRFDADEAGVAGHDAFQRSGAGMVAAAGCDHRKGAVTGKVQMRKRSWQVRAAAQR